jgi:hypothetical protein
LVPHEVSCRIASRFGDLQSAGTLSSILTSSISGGRILVELLRHHFRGILDQSRLLHWRNSFARDLDIQTHRRGEYTRRALDDCGTFGENLAVI